MLNATETVACNFSDICWCSECCFFSLLSLAQVLIHAVSKPLRLQLLHWRDFSSYVTKPSFLFDISKLHLWVKAPHTPGVLNIQIERSLHQIYRELISPFRKIPIYFKVSLKRIQTFVGLCINNTHVFFRHKKSVFRE